MGKRAARSLLLLRSYRPLAHHFRSGMVGKRASMNVPKFKDRVARLPTLQRIKIANFFSVQEALYQQPTYKGL